MKNLLLLAFALLTISVQGQTDGPGRWSAKKASNWYKKEPFLFGANYVPANAINELEMFQAETFDPATIDKELGWAEAMGVNTLRVFLHDMLWQQDPIGFRTRLDQFLAICQQHKIRPMLVLFDSCWDSNPKFGKQKDPVPGVHNSGWLQSPGADALTDSTQYPRLEAYVAGIVGAFRNDNRILAWDIWNEPDNTNDSSYGKDNLKLEPANKVALVTRLLPMAFGWARAANPSQPLTSSVWIVSNQHDWSTPATWSATERIQLENSDIITFHNYAPVPSFEKSVGQLRTFNRPIICTEFLARSVGSKFQTHLPVAKREKVGMICWGFVVGKTQTNLPWDSWQKPYVGDHKLKIWHHEILNADGSAYDPAEVTAIKEATGKQ
jgi:Cellulase (glycosyl hydrolase family 5)